MAWKKPWHYDPEQDGATKKNHFGKANQNVWERQTAKCSLFLYFVAFLSGIVIDGRSFGGV
jgi:hypothetical protein